MNVIVLASAIAGVRQARATGARLRYEVLAKADGSDLQIETNVPAGLHSPLVVDPEATAFVDDVRREESGRWLTVARTNAGWLAPECRRSGCQIRYLFHLRAAALAIDDPDTAAERGGALVAPASTWLLRPETLPVGGLRAQVHVKVPVPFAFVTGLDRVPHEADTYLVALLPYFVSPYAAFGRFDHDEIHAGGATIDLEVESGSLARELPRLRTWVGAAAAAVSTYYGRFPVDHALVLAVPQAAGFHGKAMGGGGAAVLLQMAPGAELNDPGVDWQATHEMVHLAVPELPRDQIWLSEGLATYVEPLARSMNGELLPGSVWRDLVKGLPKGQPEPGDRGLDRTHTWGRTYWGGALFAFVADLEIRKATQNSQSLMTALRGALAAGADARVQWPVERFLTACDHATGTTVLIDLYRRMGTRPVNVDLQTVWRELGVSLSVDRVDLDPRAPLAPIRRSMIGRENP
jgi:hypothetical protein